MGYNLQFARNKERQRAYIETILAWNEKDYIEYAWRSVIGGKGGFEFQRALIV